MIKDKREKMVIRTSAISIATNILLVIMKAVVGVMANSIAIITDAVNNLSDALSSIITIVGTKLANRKADHNHPYGHGRTEYITSLLVSIIVLYAGVTALIESIKKIFSGDAVDYSFVTITVLIIGIVGKFILGIYVKDTGKKINSGALRASGVDAFNDGLLSMSVLIAVIIYLVFEVNVEAYVGALVSLYIIKTGVELIKESIDSMIGKRVDHKVIDKIKEELLKDPRVLGVYDVILNDYGPEQYMGSAHIELPNNLTVSDIDKLSRQITQTVLNKYGVILHTIGVYSVNRKDPESRTAYDEIKKIVFSHQGVLEMHGFSLDKKNKIIVFDIVVDFNEPDHDKLRREILSEIRKNYPEHKVNIVLDVDTSVS